jgi:hypothetical protein
MKKSLLFLAPFLLLFSCLDSEEGISPQLLEGMWVSEIVDDNVTFDYIFNFNPNGTFESYFIIKEIQEEKYLGIEEYVTGNFSIRDGLLFLSNRRFFYPENKFNPDPETMIEKDTRIKHANKKMAFAFENNREVLVMAFAGYDAEGLNEEELVVVEVIPFSYTFQRIRDYNFKP